MIDKKFIISLQGKNFVKFEGLLDEFFKNKGKEIYTKELETSTPEEPRFKATVKGERGIFQGHGDANDKSVNRMVAVHKYRMAETRAIARALRFYNNIGMCSSDELGGESVKTVAKPKANETFKTKYPPKQELQPAYDEARKESQTLNQQYEQ